MDVDTNEMREVYRPLREARLSNEEKSSMLAELKAKMSSETQAGQGSQATDPSQSGQASQSAEAHRRTKSRWALIQSNRFIMPSAAAVVMIAVVAGGIHFFQAHPSGSESSGTAAVQHQAIVQQGLSESSSASSSASASAAATGSSAANSPTNGIAQGLVSPTINATSLRGMSVAMTSQSGAWAWGYDFTAHGQFKLLASSNAGLSWQPVPNLPIQPPNYVLGMGTPYLNVEGSFLSANTGWIAFVQNGSLITEWTQDGGQTMHSSQMSLTSSIASVQQLDFVNATQGFALLAGAPSQTAEQKYLYETTNGGQTWQLVATAKPGQLPSGGTAVHLSMGADGSGWLVTNNPNQHVSTLYHTTDQGRVWTPVQLPMGSAAQAPETVMGITIPVFDKQNGVVAVGMIGNGRLTRKIVVYHTSNGGQTWTPVSQPTFQLPGVPNNQPLMDFLTPQVGFGINGETLYKTTDGGAHWSEVTSTNLKTLASQYVGPISEVHFVNQQQGYVVLMGNDMQSELLVTTDGGKTWTPS